MTRLRSSPHSSSSPSTPTPTPVNTTRLLSLAALVACAVPTVVAQDLFVPASHATSEGLGGTMVRGLGTAGRQQILLDAAHLDAARGRILHGLSFRRDLGAEPVMGGSDLDVIVRLAPAARTVDAPSTNFAANLGAGVVEVFRGRIHVGQSTAPTSGVVTWDAPYTLEIPFQADYAYAGGDLVVEIEGTPLRAGGFHWVADRASSLAAGTVQQIGHACGPHAPVHGANSGVSPRDLVPGQVASFSLLGEPGALAILGIGLAPRAQSLDLTAFGAPGCGLFVDPVMTAATVLSAQIDPAFAVSAAQIRLPLPSDAAMFNARFACQWFEFGATLRTYHGFDCTMAGSTGGLGMAVVAQGVGDDVEIVLNSAPALRFDVR